MKCNLLTCLNSLATVCSLKSLLDWVIQKPECLSIWELIPFGVHLGELHMSWHDGGHQPHWVTSQIIQFQKSQPKMNNSEANNLFVSDSGYLSPFFNLFSF